MFSNTTKPFSSTPKTDILSCRLPNRENPKKLSIKVVDIGFSFKAAISPSTHKKKISLKPSIRETTYKNESKGTYAYLEELENDSLKTRKNVTRHLSLLYQHRDVYVSDGKSKLLRKVSRPNQEKDHTLQIANSLAKDFELSPPKCSCTESIKVDKANPDSKTSLKFSFNNPALEHQNSLANLELATTENENCLVSEELNSLEIHPHERKIYDWLDEEKVFIVAVDQKAAYNERLRLESLNNIRLNTPDRKMTERMSPMLKRRIAKGGITNPIIKSLKLMDLASCNSSDNLTRILNAEMEI